ncbi:hypothetical protein CEE39_04380 [bacterium (candidate division B38) B3_B38]|nr:MAG: hypothetical protein CEE39_04380 [bacterium (candidate division B38) B3_B38]
MLSKLVKKREGFTLIELLIVVAIIGIIAAIAVPQLLNAIQRAKQKRTMADMRSIGESMEIYQIDWNFYPKDSDTEGIRLLNPDYMRNPPINDAWNNPYEYTPYANDQEYSIISNGRDATPGDQSQGETHLFDDDIIFSNGQFTRWPEGVQR